MTIEELLARVRTRVRGGPAGAPPPPVPPAAPDPLGLLARFEAEAARVNCVTSRAASIEEAREQILEVASRHRVRRAVCWEHPLLEVLGPATVLARRDIRVESAAAAARSPDAREAWLRTLAAADLGISGVDVAVAETGTLVLHAGSGRGRLVTCLPPVHLAVLTLDALVADLFHLPARWQTLPSAAHLITGPSRTADIELSLTRGVHGPAEVHVLACLFPAPAGRREE
jgi:L-lactate dehydrogenase complex protein LldG